MKKVVFANWGTAKQGKSSTVKEIAQIILKNYPAAISEPSPIVFRADIKVIIKIDKIIIGVESIGDPNSRLFDSLKDFVKMNCDIIICSTRSTGATVEAVEKLVRNGYQNVWVTNYRSNEKDQDRLNKISAQHIFELIQEHIAAKI